MKLSIIIPAFNELSTIEKTIETVKSVNIGNIEKEIIIIDDGSTDGTKDFLQGVKNFYIVIFNKKNEGKGVSIKKGFAVASGDISLIQDADLECDPQNYPFLIKPILDNEADVVFGSRFKNKDYRHAFYIFHISNKFITFFSNICTGFNLTDIWTGYKVFSKKAIKEILPHITGKRFEIEPELTALVVRKKLRIKEIPIYFLGKTRNIRQGKKFRIRDGLLSLWYIFKFNFLRKYK